jgi:hypothetical protein
MTRLSEELHGTLDEAGLSAAERKAGKVDARKMSEQEVLGLLADGKQVVVTKKMAHRVPKLLQPHGLVIRSFWAGPRSEWHGLALVGSKEKAAKLKAAMKEGLDEGVIPGLDIFDLPHGMVGLVVFVENMDAWLKEIRKGLGQIGKGKDDPRTVYQAARTIVGNLGTMKVETDRQHKMVSGAFKKMPRK